MFFNFTEFRRRADPAAFSESGNHTNFPIEQSGLPNLRLQPGHIRAGRHQVHIFYFGGSLNSNDNMKATNFLN
jgi:hypothetical protein